MKRRGFLAGILAAGFAPAVVGSGILMPVKSGVQIATAEEIAALSAIDTVRKMFIVTSVLHDSVHCVPLVNGKPQFAVPKTQLWFGSNYGLAVGSLIEF